MKRLFACILAMAGCLQLMAWDAVGHRIVAEIAYQHLTRKARKNVDATLGVRGMVYTSSWADEIKSDTIYPQSYYWHFQDLKKDMTDEELVYLYEHKKAEGEHLLYAKDSLITLLKTDKHNADALKFLVHFCGDEYQPMHVGRIDDVAGNRTRMTWFGQKMNMHSLWDRYLIQYPQMTSSEWVTYLMDKYAPEMKTYRDMSELDCLRKTYQAQCAIYDYYELNLKAELPRSYEYKYYYNFKSTLEQQLYMAGIQLAKTLNEIYK